MKVKTTQKLKALVRCIKLMKGKCLINGKPFPYSMAIIPFKGLLKKSFQKIMCYTAISNPFTCTQLVSAIKVCVHSINTSTSDITSNKLIYHLTSLIWYICLRTRNVLPDFKSGYKYVKMRQPFFSIRNDVHIQYVVLLLAFLYFLYTLWKRDVMCTCNYTKWHCQYAICFTLNW